MSRQFYKVTMTLLTDINPYNSESSDIVKDAETGTNTLFLSETKEPVKDLQELDGLLSETHVDILGLCQECLRDLSDISDQGCPECAGWEI